MSFQINLKPSDPLSSRSPHVFWSEQRIKFSWHAQNILFIFAINCQIELGVSKLRTCREVVILGTPQEFSFYGQIHTCIYFRSITSQSLHEFWDICELSIIQVPVLWRCQQGEVQKYASRKDYFNKTKSIFTPNSFARALASYRSSGIPGSTARPERETTNGTILRKEHGKSF